MGTNEEDPKSPETVTFWAPQWLVQQVRGSQEWPDNLSEQPITLTVTHPDPSLLTAKAVLLSESQIQDLSGLFDRIGRWPGDTNEPMPFRNDVFSVMRYRWDDCSCWDYLDDAHLDNCLNEIPNFLHHKSGVAIRWYKHFGRCTEFIERTPNPTPEMWTSIIDDSNRSLGGETND